MEHRKLGNTDLRLPVLGFGASSLGAEFRSIDIQEAMRAVHAALDSGMDLIDTSPFYGRGMSEVLLGVALKDVPRDRYLLCSKLGRYDVGHFDFSARRVAESVDVSLKRMRVDHLDICLCHDIEFVEMSQIVEETLPALRKEKEKGKVRYIGVSGYPMKMFRYVLERSPIDVLLSYNHYTLQNTMLSDLVPVAREKGVGVMNAAPFSARLLSNAPLPPWHKATPEVREVARRAAQHCARRGVDIAQLAVWFSTRPPEIATTIAGSASPERVREWATWIERPVDPALIREVQEILSPIHNWFYIEGRPENNDDPNDRRPSALLGARPV
jgi:aryl-alcohol dehydrogenase-like predicted oxidoreductase